MNYPLTHYTFLLFILTASASVHRSSRDKRQFPGLGGLGGLGDLGSIPGLGSLSGGPSSGSGIASFPGLDQPTIIQPAAGQPCPVALVPQQFGGGLKFGNPFNFGFDLKGQDADNGPWGTGFDTNVGQEYGGSIFGDAGHEAKTLDCKMPDGSTGTTMDSGVPNAGGGGLPPSGSNPIADVLAENPDLLRKALEQNPDIIKGNTNRQQVEAALENNPELIRQALLANPELIQGGLGQLASGGQSQGPASASSSSGLKNAVIRRLVKDSKVMRQFVEEHGYSIREGLKRNGLTRTLSDDELMQLMASNPAILDQIFNVSPGLVAKTASKYRISEDWDALPVDQSWGGPQAAVYDAFYKDPFFMEQVLREEPLYLRASMKKGKFDTGDLSDDQIRQVLFDHPEYVRAMLARDSVFAKHIQQKYGVVAGKEYTRQSQSRAERAFKYLSRNDALMDRAFRENPTDVKRAVAKQKVDPSQVTMDNIIKSYHKRPNMLKLMLLQNPEFVTKTLIMYREMEATGGVDTGLGLAGGSGAWTDEEEPETSTERVKIRTGTINTQFLRDSAQAGQSPTQLGSR